MNTLNTPSNWTNTPNTTLTREQKAELLAKLSKKELVEKLLQANDRVAQIEVIIDLLGERLKAIHLAQPSNEELAAKHLQADRELAQMAVMIGAVEAKLLEFKIKANTENVQEILK